MKVVQTKIIKSEHFYKSFKGFLLGQKPKFSLYGAYYSLT